ncbi:MAG TPA: alpha,alpha-trehalase TreF [Parasegetibacter sp.]
MNRRLYGLTLIVSFIILGNITCRQVRNVHTSSPRWIYGQLFEAAQTLPLFEDSKLFPDCTPLDEPKKILERYEAEKNNPNFDLSTFVHSWFILPPTPTQTYSTNRAHHIFEHIDTLWTLLTRKPDTSKQNSTLIPLPHAYIVPGGRFREIYYWDSYFTMLGLKESGHIDLIENMVNNFAWMLNTYGFIPNGNRTYYLTRSQPPYFSLMVQLLAASRPDQKQQILATYLDALRIEYDFWMGTSETNTSGAKTVKLPNGGRLNRYYDTGNWPREEAWKEDISTAKSSERTPETEVYRELRSGAESGWDYSSRWFQDGKTLASIHVTDIIPVDLNCLLYYLEITLHDASRASGKIREAEEYLLAANDRASSIQQYCWNKKYGWFCDYDHKNNQHTPSMNLAGVYPLFFNIARNSQADSITKKISSAFLYPGGLVTSTAETGQQWDFPNGWAPLHWMTIQGLRNYKQDSLAQVISSRWTHLIEKTFEKTGKLLEKYNVVDTTLIGGGGEYPNQDGFGWTNGVYLKLRKLYPVSGR